MNEKVMRQSKMPAWIGAFQVQVMNSFFYLNLISSAMMILTFWYTAGYQIADKYFPWLSLRMFVLVVIILFGLIMFIDYKFILPSRQAFINNQSFKHENEAMIAIRDIQERLKRIEESQKQ